MKEECGEGCTTRIEESTLTRSVTMKLSRLAGDDIFISYSRADAVAYAAGLANSLSARGFSCYIDQWGSEPGTEIPRRVLSRMERSGMLVVVGSPRAAASIAVGREVAAFLATARPIVPISVDGAAEQSAWFVTIAGAALSFESAAALTDGKPSEPVLSRIENSFRFTKRNARVRRAFLAAGAGLLSMIGLATWRQHEASVATAQAQRAQADASTFRAEAAARGRIADKQTALAAENARKALEQQRLADDRMRRARALELAAASRTVVEGEPDLAALLAVRSFATADVFEARQALLASLSHHPLLERVLIGPEEGRRRGSSGSIDKLWFSADGKEIAAGRSYEEMSIWTENRGHLRRTSTPKSDIREEVISADFNVVAGERLADKTVHVFSRRSGTRHHFKFDQPDGIETMALSSDGTRLATGTRDGIVEVWDTGSGTRLGEPFTKSNFVKRGDFEIYHRVSVLKFSPDGKALYWRTDDDAGGSVDIVTRTPTAWRPEECPAVTAFAGDGEHVAFIDGGSIGSGRLHEGKLIEKQDLLRNNSVHVVAISADGKRIAAGTGEGVLYLFQYGETTTIQAHSASLDALAFSPDGLHLVTGGRDGRVLLWRTEGTALYDTVPLSRISFTEASSVRFTPDGKHLLATMGNSILVVDPVRARLDGPPIRCEGSRLAGVAVHPDGKTIIAGGPRHVLFFPDLKTRRCTKQHVLPGPIRDFGKVTALAFSPAGTFLATGDSEGGIGVWAVGTLRGKYLREADDGFQRVTSIVWTPDGKALAVGANSGAEQVLWPVGPSKTTVVLQDALGRSGHVAISRDRQLLAGVGRDGIRVWNAVSGQEIARFAIDKLDVNADAANTMAFSGDNALLAVGQANQRLSLFDLTEKRWLADLPLTGCVLGCAVASIDFSPEGERLAAFVPPYIQIWDLDPHSLAVRASELANRKLTKAEQNRYLRDTPSGAQLGGTR